MVAIEPLPTQPVPPSMWAAIANVRDPCLIGPNGGTPRPGTKHFRGGAKVYVIDAYWGTCDSVTVIAQHRKSRRFIRIDMPARHLENFRPHVVYSPTVLRLARDHFEDRPLPVEEDAKRLCEALPMWNDSTRGVSGEQ